MANNRKYSYDKLAEVNSNGIDIALFPQIREAIAERLKEIFGNDIDLSTASADGQYINMESLIFNNMYQLLSYLFDNINPNTASGKYLDILSSMSNIKRKGPTYSTVQLAIKYVGVGTLAGLAGISVQDRNGVEWYWQNPIDASTGVPKYTFTSGDDPLYLTFTCKNLGPVQAYRGTAVGDPSDPSFWTQANFQDNNGSVYLELSSNFLVYETSDAILGTYNETDQSLRNRRAKYIGGNSVTTQQGLETAIYNYAAVEDVYILNNVTGSQQVLTDGATVENHDVYIAVRYKENVDTTNTANELATIIYEKLTPGVNTSDGGGTITTGETVENIDIEFVNGYNTTIYWKVCTPVKPTIVITFKELNNLYIEGSGGNYSDCELSIINSIKNYINNLPIDSRVTAAEIQVAMMSGDLRPNGTVSFIPTAATIDGVSEYTAPVTYFKYDTSDFVFDYITDPANPTLTIG